MKNVSILCFLAVVTLLTACQKENITTTPLDEVTSQEATSIPITDWATGGQIGTIETVSVSERSPTTYGHSITGATTKYGVQSNFFQGGTLISSTAWVWIDAGTGYYVSFSGDCANEYTMVVNYKRKVPSIPCNLTVNWSTTPGTTSSNQTFTIGVNGTTRSNLFYACE
jgi:hypothetical protein